MADSSSVAKQPSRRQEHKRRTELALQQAALELFAKFGYDTTTTDEISEKAGVSPRTFFRYFPTKESVLFRGEYGWFQSFTEILLQQPASLTEVDAVFATLVALAPRLSQRRRFLLLYERAVASSVTLRGGVHDHQQEDIETLAEAIAKRRGLTKPDKSAILLATVSLGTYRRSISLWLAGPASIDPSAVVAEQFEMLGALFTPKSPVRRQGLNGRTKSLDPRSTPRSPSTQKS